MSGRDRALLRSQSAPVAGFTVLNPLFTVDTDGARSVQGVASAASGPPVAPFQPYLPVWPSLDAFGHHRAACARCGLVRSGKRRWEGLQRGRGKGWPLTSSPKIWILECPMPSITGGSRLLPAGPTRRGHNPRFCSSGRWRTSAGCS